MIKKIMSILLIMIVLLITACTNEINDEIITNLVESNADTISVKHKNYEMTIDSKNGNITKLFNKAENINYIEDSIGGNFSFLIDLSTSNAFKTNTEHEHSVMVSSRKYTPTVSFENGTKNSKVLLVFDISLSDKVKVTVENTWTFSKDSKEILVDYMIYNDSSQETNIINFTSAIISGLKNPEDNDLSLFWPNKEGKIYDNAVTQAFRSLKLQEQYPSPISMQLIQLFNEDSSLYYYVADNKREYKTFNFGDFTSKGGHDHQTVEIQDKVSLSATQYPFLASKTSKKLSTTHIGFSNDNSWYEGADAYREFLITSGMDKSYNKYTAEWTGFIADTVAGFDNQIKKMYVGENTSDQVIKGFDQSLVDTVVLFGWHEGGFDSKYPDYEYFDGTGFGEANFITMVENAHKNGDYIIPYLNAHIIATNSEWGNTKFDDKIDNLHNSSVKKQGFNPTIDSNQYKHYMYYESYGTNIGYYAACPASDEFINQILEVVGRLADAGVDGLWMDQMMEMPAYLCYDESHNHENPATAYAEGYKRMYEGIHQIFDEHEIEALIFAEGVTDAWIEYIDIPGYMWARHLYAPDNVNPGDGVLMSPNITVYTMPSKFLGISSFNKKVEHADAFLFGSPLASANSLMDKMIRTVYINNKDIYMYGRYMDEKGLEINNGSISGSIILSNEAGFSINLYNNSNSVQSVKITVDLMELNISLDKVSSVLNLFNNEEVKFVFEEDILIINLYINENDLIGMRVS